MSCLIMAGDKGAPEAMSAAERAAAALNINPAG
jgi:hypothetical protein